MFENKSSVFILVGSLVFAVAAGAFWLSFEAIQSIAIQYGIPEKNAWVFPLLVDGAITIYSITRLYGALTSEKGTERWSFVLIFVFVGLSILFNISTTIRDGLSTNFDFFVSFIVHALPPVVLFSSFEMLMMLLHDHVRRGELFVRKKSLITQVEKLESKKDALGKQVQVLEEKAEKAKQGTKTGGPIEQQFLLTYVEQHPDASLREIGDVIGKSASTVKSYADRLKKAGHLEKNGHGWIVNK